MSLLQPVVETSLASGVIRRRFRSSTPTSDESCLFTLCAAVMEEEQEVEGVRRSLGSTGPLPDQLLSVVESPLSSQWSQFCPLQVVQSQPLRVFPFHDAAGAMSCRGRPIHSPLLLCSRHSVRPCNQFHKLGSLCLASEAACISRRAKSSWALAILLTSILEGLVHFVLTVSLPNITQIHATLCDCSASISACFGLVSQSRVLTAFLFKKNPLAPHHALTETQGGITWHA